MEGVRKAKVGRMFSNKDINAIFEISMTPYIRDSGEWIDMQIKDNRIN